MTGSAARSRVARGSLPLWGALLASLLPAACAGHPAAGPRATATSTSPAAAASPSVPASASASAPAPGSGDCAQRQLAALSRQQRAAQLFDVGVPVDSLGGAPALVAQGVGGVFLHGRSTAGLRLAPALHELVDGASRAGRVPPHVTADEEGGAVQSVRGPGIPAWPSARAQASWSLPDLRTRSAAWAASLHDLGVTLDLGPVADVVSVAGRTTNPPIGRLAREYGSTGRSAAPRVAVVTAALEAAGVGATAKHFPGLGRVTANTDTSAAAVDRTATRDDPDLAPFAAAVAAGATAVMVSSASYPRLDPAEPAVWSRAVVTDLLRGQLHFPGLVLSDDLSQAAAVAAVAPGDRVVRFLEAGGDMAVVVDGGAFAPMLAAVLAEAGRSPAFAARVDDAAAHVLASKVRARLLACPAG